MKLNKFKEKIIKLIEDTGEFIAHDSEIDEAFKDLAKMTITDSSTSLVVCGTSPKETFAIVIVKIK